MKVKKYRDSLLWRIHREGATQVSYVFGTIHLWDESYEGILAFAKKYLLQCEVYAGESDIEALRDLDSSYFYNLDNQGLSEFYSPKKYLKMCQMFHKITGQSLAYFEGMTPFAVNSMLNQFFISSSEHSIDSLLWYFAKAADLPTCGIESAEEQLAYYRKISLAEQAKQLGDILGNVTRYRRHLDTMKAAYLATDCTKLYKNAKKSFKESRKMMIDERNEIMSARIANFAERHSIFAALGAGHLSGQKGILRLLRKAGFVVTPVNFKSKNDFSNL